MSEETTQLAMLMSSEAHIVDLPQELQKDLDVDPDPTHRYTLQFCVDHADIMRLLHNTLGAL